MFCSDFWGTSSIVVDGAVTGINGTFIPDLLHAEAHNDCDDTCISSESFYVEPEAALDACCIFYWDIDYFDCTTNIDALKCMTLWFRESAFAAIEPDFINPSELALVKV